MAHPEKSLNAGAGRGGSTWGAFAKRALDLALPPRCLSCGVAVHGGDGLCAECWADVSFLSAPMCSVCGFPFEVEVSADALCGSCLGRRPAFDRARAALVYDDASRPILISFKHRDRVDMTPSLARWMSRAGAEMIRQADIVAPVPLHWTRLLARRFNQSAELARRIAAAGALPYAPVLLGRRRRTPPQTGLNARQRNRNVRGAFHIKPSQARRVAGKRVLVVDDVLTTGSTVSACAGVLKWAGAEAVDVLTAARVVRADGGRIESG